MDGPINRGELMSHNLTELIKPESYEVRLTPITRFGEGDSTIRIVRYSGECSFLNSKAASPPAPPVDDATAPRRTPASSLNPGGGGILQPQMMALFP